MTDSTAGRAPKRGVRQAVGPRTGFVGLGGASSIAARLPQRLWEEGRGLRNPPPVRGLVGRLSFRPFPCAIHFRAARSFAQRAKTEHREHHVRQSLEVTLLVRAVLGGALGVQGQAHAGWLSSASRCRPWAWRVDATPRRKPALLGRRALGEPRSRTSPPPPRAPPAFFDSGWMEQAKAPAWILVRLMIHGSLLGFGRAEAERGPLNPCRRAWRPSVDPSSLRLVRLGVEGARHALSMPRDHRPEGEQQMVSRDRWCSDVG